MVDLKVTLNLEMDHDDANQIHVHRANDANHIHQTSDENISSLRLLQI
jgi:hypothetical protein